MYGPCLHIDVVTYMNALDANEDVSQVADHEAYHGLHDQSEFPVSKFNWFTMLVSNCIC